MPIEPHTTPLTDAEMIALAAVAHCEAVLMAGDNLHREQEGLAPAWRNGCGMLPAGNRLSFELQRRGIAP